MRLLLGSNNKGKVIEIREALSELPLSIVTPEDLKIQEVPEEIGQTYQENAEIKSRFFHARSRLPTVADDSGIIVEALQGELGVYTRRWGAGPEVSDAQWIAHFLDRMKNETNRKACFVCNLAYIDAAGQLHIFEGQCEGTITKDIEADSLPGLPISAVFKPYNHSSVYSALSPTEKNLVSHRGVAVSRLRNHLLQSLDRDTL